MTPRWHDRRRWAASVVLVAMVAVISPVSVPGSAAAATSPPTSTPASATVNTWHIASTLALGTESTAASCPTRTRCWAIEAGELIATTDAGLTWSTATSAVPGDVVSLDDLTCPSRSLCYLTATLDSGLPSVVVLQAGEMTAFAAPGSTPLPTISCPAVLHCVVTDGRYAYVTHDGAATWVTHLLPGEPTISSLSVSCVTGSSTCWITGNYGETPIIEKTTDDGVTWEFQTAPSLTDGMYDVECPSLRTCYAVGSTFSDYATVIGTHNGGQSWVKQDTPMVGYPLYSVSCASKTTCWAGGLSPGRTPYIFATTDSGGQWDLQQLPSATSEDPPYLSCASTQVCVAVRGGVTYETADGGATWTDVDVPAAVAPPQALSCPTRTHCVALSNDAAGRGSAMTSEDSGTTWTPHALLGSLGPWYDVDCPAASVCFAVSTTAAPGRPNAYRSRVLSSTDGGASWHQDRIPDRRGSLVLVSCPSTTTCLALGRSRGSTELIRTTDGGRTWTSVTPPQDALYPGGLSCASVSACVLVVENDSDPSVAWTTSDLGETFEQQTLPSAYYFDLACSGLTCVTVGWTIFSYDPAMSRSIDGGRTWEPVDAPSSLADYGQVSCGSATACAATGYTLADGTPLIVGTTDAGQTWKTFRLPARNERPDAVACFRAFCIASDTSPTGSPLILAGRA